MKVLYHANCTDGAGAALAVWMKHGDTGHEYIPVQHAYPMPDGLDGEDVVMVDFSYKKPQIRDLARRAKSILILDHHKSAQEELDGVDDGYGCTMDIIFDMDKSGAVLAWEHFHETPVPKLFKYIQDRDLWHFVFVDTKDVITGLRLWPLWRDWVIFIHNPREINCLTTEGEAINLFLELQAKKIILQEPCLWSITGEIVPLYNLPGFMISDTLDRALDRYPKVGYAVGYFDLSDRRVFSLRSRQGSDVDVSKIAKKYGGGGHKHAAGFVEIKHY